MSDIFDLSFYSGKRVFVTGHTGFKGSWLCRLLINAGAEVTGYALEAERVSLFRLAGLTEDMTSVIGDVRNYQQLKAAFDRAQPEIVFHLAAQPIVREGYRNPACTYETNVMGTVNILECIRESRSVRSFLNVTTDKVYFNSGGNRCCNENDALNGFDPYSNSKSCSELVTNTYKNCYFDSAGISVSTARAGNVIGGGDFGADRIIPDCIRAVTDGRKIIVRNPRSVRPYQHVLDALTAYLTIAAGQYGDPALAGSYNVGPEADGCITTGELAEMFCQCWGGGAEWEAGKEDGIFREDNVIRLDCSKIRTILGWEPVWSINRSMENVCRFTKICIQGGSIIEEMEREIVNFLSDMSKQ